MDVRIFHDLDAVAADARGALDRAAQPSLFDRLDWYRLTLAHCPPPGRPLILRAEGDGARSWLFLMVDRGTALIMGSWYSLRFDSPNFGGHRKATLVALIRELSHHVAHVALEPLGREWWDIAVAFGEAGAWRADIVGSTINRTVAVTDWPAYWAARPARLRETVRRRSRGDPFRIVVHDRFDAAAWGHYEQVYARSWKPAEGAPAFLRALAEQEGAAGTLRLGIAWDGPRPVAAQFWLVENGRATIHKLAHDEADRARSPGTLLSHAMFRHAIAVDRVALIDFGTGDDLYKADWMDTATPLWRLDAWTLRTPRGLAGYARHRAGQLVRRLRNRYAAPQQRKGHRVKTTSDADQVDATLRSVLADVLALDPARVAAFTSQTSLFGALPELDSMAVATLLTELEDRLAFVIDDDEVDGDMLADYGALLTFVRGKALA